MGSILELLEGGVGGDGAGHVLRPNISEDVVREAAHEGRGQVLRGVDGKKQAHDMGIDIGREAHT